MMRPRHVTTKAAVIPVAGSKAASTACFTLLVLISFGSGTSDSASPIGHGCFEGSGNRLLTVIGLKLTESLPDGSVTQPWPPRYLAVRFTPFGSVTCTALPARSIIGFPIFARSLYGLTKYPTFSAAKSGSSPVMKTAEHMILTKPAAWCSSGSPGGGSYGVLSSSDFARALSASRGGVGVCATVCPKARDASANKITTINSVLFIGALLFVSVKQRAPCFHF